jgi:hypothetical protein
MVGLFSALYIVTAGLTSVITQVGYPEHFLRGIFMSALVLSTRGKRWCATMMGIVCGIVFLTVPAPAPYLLPSTVASGVIFDLVLIVSSKYGETLTQNRLLAGAGLSGLAESFIALMILSVFTTILGKTFDAIALAWSADIVLNIVLSIIGAFIAYKYLGDRLIRGRTSLTAH